MRAFIKREQNIIQVPEDFAVLSSMEDGHYLYKITYYVDPSKAFKNNALKTEIYVSPVPVEPHRSSLLSKSDSETVLNNLLQKSQRQKDTIRNNDILKGKNYIPSIVSDITKFISNGLVVNYTSIRPGKTQTVKKFRSIKPQIISDLLGVNTSVPLLDSNTNTAGNSSRNASSSEIRRLATNLLFQQKTDPASFVGKRSNTIHSAKHAYSGTIAKKTSNNRPYQEEDLLVSSLLSTVGSEQSDDQVQNIPVIADVEHIVAEETFSVPVEYIDSENFYFIFRIKNKDGIILQTISGLVNHGKQIALEKIPVVAPEIVAPKKTYFGQNRIQLKQSDPNGVMIRLYKKRFTYSQTVRDASYSLVGEVPAKPEDGFVSITDYASSTEPVVYRAVPIGSTGLLGAEFCSAVVETVRGQIGKTTSVVSNCSFVSISSKTTSDGILVSVANLPPDSISFSLKKRNLSLRQKNYTRIGPTRLVDTVDTSAVDIQDIDVSIGNIYEYVVDLHSRTGSIQQTTNSHIVEFNPTNSNILELSIGQTSIDEMGANEIDVKFSITKSVIQKSADQIKAFLTSQGFLGEFQEDIIANKEALGNLFALGVKRQNISTGETEDFGIIDSDSEFSDIAFGASKGVSPVRAGYEYKYIVTAYARNIETIMPKLEREDTTNSNLPFTYLPSEWQHPITLSHGNILTPATLKRNHAKSTFTFGSIVDVKEVIVSLSSVLPSLYDGKAKAIKNNKSVLVQWKVQGNVNKIDHFIIVLEISGIKTIVGKSHNISNTNYFQFVDSLDNKESGGLTYFIVPVYFDFSRGVELKTNQVIL